MSVRKRLNEVTALPIILIVITTITIREAETIQVRTGITAITTTSATTIITITAVVTVAEVHIIAAAARIAAALTTAVEDPLVVATTIVEGQAEALVAPAVLPVAEEVEGTRDNS